MRNEVGGGVGGARQDLFLDQADHLDVQLLVQHALFVCQTQGRSTGTGRYNRLRGGLLEQGGIIDSGEVYWNKAV